MTPLTAEDEKYLTKYFMLEKWFECLADYAKKSSSRKGNKRMLKAVIRKLDEQQETELQVATENMKT